MAVTKQRRQITEEMNENTRKVHNCIKEVNDVKVAQNAIYEAVVLMQKFQAINEAMQVQDEEDRKQTRLYGINEEFMTMHEQKSKTTLKINQNCISCSGNAQYIKKAFKLACLNYNESKVQYLQSEYAREDLHVKKTELIAKAN